MPEKLKPIAFYVRVSTSGQKYASQEAPLLSFAKRKGWLASQFEIFREKVSGVSKSRPMLEKIMNGARIGQIKTVVVYKLDRLGRSLTHLSYIVGELRRTKVAVVSVSEGIDTSADNPLASLQINLLGSFGELERDMIRERTKSGFDAARKRGVIVGRPRTGDKHKAEAVKLKKEGKGLREIAGILKISVTTAYRLTKGCGAPKKVRGQDKLPRRSRKRFSKTPPPKCSPFARARVVVSKTVVYGTQRKENAAHRTENSGFPAGNRPVERATSYGPIRVYD